MNDYNSTSYLDASIVKKNKASGETHDIVMFGDNHGTTVTDVLQIKVHRI